MGFLDSLGEYAGKKIKESMDANKEAYAEAQRLDDRKLINKYKDTSNISKKMGYAKALKERGYGNNSE